MYLPNKTLIFLLLSISFVFQHRLTSAFGGRRSIQLSYGSSARLHSAKARLAKDRTRPPHQGCATCQDAATIAPSDGSGAPGLRIQAITSAVGIARSWSRSSK